MADIAGLQAQLRQLQGSAGSEQEVFQKAAQYANANGLSADVVNQVVQGVAQNPGMWNTQRVQSIMDQYKPQPQQYGLSASMNTLGQGANAATQRIGQTQQQVGGLYNQGLQMLDPYMQSGKQADQLQAALSGALGPEAQKQAFNSYQYSPGVEFAQKEAERALLRNASATGGLGGGNVLRDLTQLAAGTAMQDFGNQFSRIGEVANRGYGAATTGAGLQGQQAQVQSGLGQFAANIPLQTSQNQAGMQFQAGRDIASNISSTTSALSNLINQQGAGMADITGNVTNNLNALFQQASAGDSNAIQQLQAMLGNLSTQTASMVAGQPVIQGQNTNYLGQLGQVASGVGGLAAGMNYGNPATQPVYNTRSPYYDNVNYGSGGAGLYG